MTTTREITIVEQGFTAAMSPWAGDYADQYDWDGIRDEYNAELTKLAPAGVTWGWTEEGAYCYAETDVDEYAVIAEWTRINGGEAEDGSHEDGIIDFERIAGHHEIAPEVTE